MWRLLLKPWILALGGGASAYFFARKCDKSTARLRETKLELVEQQRTIDRLRAELGRERALRRQQEDSEGSDEDARAGESLGSSLGSSNPEKNNHKAE